MQRDRQFALFLSVSESTEYQSTLAGCAGRQYYYRCIVPTASGFIRISANFGILLQPAVRQFCGTAAVSDLGKLVLAIDPFRCGNQFCASAFTQRDIP